MDPLLQTTKGEGGERIERGRVKKREKRKDIERMERIGRRGSIPNGVVYIGMAAILKPLIQLI